MNDPKKQTFDRREAFEVRKRSTSTAPDLVIRILDVPQRGARWRPTFVVKTAGIRGRP
jgi:hypothetical protein